MANFKPIKTLVKSVFLLACLAFLAYVPFRAATAAELAPDVLETRITVIFFHSDTCPHCRAEKAFLDQLAGKYPDIKIDSHEISEAGNQELYRNYGSKTGVPESALSIYAVPLTIIEGKYFLGYQADNTTGAEIENAIGLAREGNNRVQTNTRTGFSILGIDFTIDKNAPLSVLAVIFGLADGINPCMFSVLMMLLAYLLSAGSSRRAMFSGFLFGASVFAIYFLMMVGIYKSLTIFGQSLAQWLIPLKLFFGWIFLAVGLWMVKDFFFLKEGQKISFSIPKAAHPAIKKLVSQTSYAAVILLALFSSLVELPCTFALPLGYVTILAGRGIFAYPYIVLYNIFFVLPLFVIVFAVGLGFSKINQLQNWRERSKKTMRLVSGLLLTLLGIAFLFKVF